MKIDITKFKDFFKKLPEILAGHAFLSVLVIILLEMILGAVLFYKYSMLPEQTEIQAPEDVVQFKQEVYEEVSNKWIEQRRKFEKTQTKEYFDFFQPK